MEYKFSELFRWTSGKPIIPTEGSIPVYGSNGIIGYTDKAKYENKIILGRVGAYCGSVEYCEGVFNATDNTLITTCDTNRIRYRYAYYLLKQYNLNGYAGGSAQPLITQGLLKHLKCNIPDVQRQDKIAARLNEYDSLIELNNKRIKLLEQIAENLYKEWFVRFRFPGHETAEFENGKFGKMPTCFSIIKMQDAFDYYIGGGWGNDDKDAEFSEEAYVIRGTDFPHVNNGDLSTCPLRYHKASNYKARKLQENDIVMEVSGGTAEQPVGRTLIVTKDIVDRLTDKVICASFCKLIRLNTEIVTPFYFYYWMQYLYDTRIIDKFQLQSTGIINFKFDYFLRKGDLMLPPMEVMQQFDGFVSSLYEEKAALAKANDNLIKQRDLLLPRLMSGKLKV